MTDSNLTAVKPKRFPWVVVILGLAAFIVLLCLGTWQVERLQWKEGLLATIEQRTHAAPLPLNEIEAKFKETGDVEYWPVTATGQFLHDKESHFFATHEGMTGFYVYTPLQLADGRAVLVNRGFVSYDDKNPGRRPAGQVTGEVTVTGLARNPLTEKPSSMVPDNDLVKDIFYWKDWGVMADRSGLARDKIVPFFIDANNAQNPGGIPMGGVTIVALTNNHLQYAVTWYGLAAALAGVLSVYLWRNRNTA